MERPEHRSLPLLRAVAAAALLALLLGSMWLVVRARVEPAPSFRDQACSLDSTYLRYTQTGYRRGRSGQIQLIPQHPAYFASGAGGWTHSGPWPYLQDVPLVFYGPGLIGRRGEVRGRTTLADVAPTLSSLMGFDFEAPDGRELAGVTDGAAPRPKLITTVVWDGGGWNTLGQWPDAWPNLKRVMERGISFPETVVGSSPSVTPSVHTTIGTGAFPWVHGITDIPVLTAEGGTVDSFQGGRSSSFIDAPTLAELWDEANDNDALVGMIGYEPWHLGMIGKGAEGPGGDADHAAWLNTETNEWVTNEGSYQLPPSVPGTEGLQEDVRRLDAADGEIDGAWGDHDILEDRSRIEEVPAFISYHGRVLQELIVEEGYGEDRVTDLLFTNFKQIDRLGHYFGMSSEEVKAAVVETDRQLGELESFLNEEVGRGSWVLVVTADHGQQPDASEIDAYAIDPNEVLADIGRRFGEIAIGIRPTQVFLDEAAMRREDVTVDEVARFLSNYRLQDNATDPRQVIAGAGSFEPSDRLFAFAAPSDRLDSFHCSR
jgi:arylsulfatase A-like enzyme